MDKADVIRRVAEALTEGNIGRASEIAMTEYPFVAAVASKRQYTPFQSLQVFHRDGFIDRYSAERLVNPGALHVLSKTLPLEFPAHPNWRMSESHMVYWELFPTIDHVVPVARGGADDDSNWVTTSMVRNAAKSNWMLDELGWRLVDPGDPSTWDGLSRWFVDYVDAHQELLTDPYIGRWSNATRRVINART
jgi:5-methylcytosine-specific restriction endonuclease McrA